MSGDNNRGRLEPPAAAFAPATGPAGTRPGDRVGAPVRERQVPAVERAIAILRLLARSESPLGVQAIARELGLVPSTCLHILRVLVAEELAGFDPETKRYRLDAGILSIARGVLGRSSFSRLVQPALDRIAKRHAVTANAVRVVGLAHGTVVAMSHAAQPFHIHVGVGSRFPALVSVTGRCIAAFGNHDWADIEEAFHRVRWERPPSLRAWRGEVEEARRTGYAVDAGNYICGITIVGAPVMDRGRVGHVIVGIGLTEQLKAARRARLGRDLQAAAREMSERLRRE
ncbi:MAG TPA: IclR family transcriptional regulator [Hyphomicrobiaceae bacterium]|nr:IclR family transcriptional regulator [Hyphomicrobiaceae bacterium]